jgi:hypothetical protein
MKLSRHDRYDYSPITERPDYDWPGGKRLAFYLALNIEHFHFGEGRGHTPTREAPHPDHRNYAWRDYGLRVGIWRIFDLLDELGLPAAHLLNSTVYDHAPPILDRIRTRGDEIVGHGRTNSEAQGQLSEPDEDLLKEAGYSYQLDWPFDDQPIWMRTRAGPILSIPYPVEINDSPALLNRRHTADDFARMAIDQFEQLLADSKHQPLVCGISTHTFAVGQPFRLPHLRRMLEHVVNHPDVERVWFTRPGDIARHIATLEPGIVPGS